MIETSLIDGKAIAAGHLAEIAAAVATMARPPGLAVILVGDDPASQVYVRNKTRETLAAGMRSFEHRLPAETDQPSLLALIDSLNHAPDVDGILVQLPLPRQIDPARVLAAIDPAKDVDGFHLVNVGRLATGSPGLVPCTPLGCLHLLRQVCPDLAGRSALVLGRSNIVGKPMAHLLLGADCTVTIAHSKTRDLAALCRSAEILVAAIGRPEFVPGSWIRPGAIVIDVGINRVAAGGGRTRLVGDVATAEAQGIAAAITPVPGGVGPMTIAMLLSNTLHAARARQG